MPIQILPPRLANQIAAGEVVERPASVVKELVENSLDAGATKIDVELEKGGAKLIRIRDNGCGVGKEELELALSRHATSKVTCLDDLEAIISLGFRGEALASISSVSRLTFASCTQAQQQGWQAYAEGRDMAVQLQPTAHPVGTTVEVADLFFNTPARRRFLRSEKTEFGHIETLIKRLALSHFKVHFTLKHNGKMVKNFRPALSLAQQEKRVAAVCSSQFMQHALAINAEHGDLKLSGWIVEPSGARAQNDVQYCYVNGRMMRDKLINHAIRQAYADKLPSHLYAAFIIYIELSPTQVDVNVHPAKHEVRFHQGRLVHDFILQTLNDALTAQPSALNHGLDTSEQAGSTHEASPADAFKLPDQGGRQVRETQARGVNHGYKSNAVLADADGQLSHHRDDLKQNAGQYSPRSPLFSSTKQALAQSVWTQSPPAHGAEIGGSTLAQDVATSSGHFGASLHLVDEKYLLLQIQGKLQLLSLPKAWQLLVYRQLLEYFQQQSVSQPLLLPVAIKAGEHLVDVANFHQASLNKLGLQLKTQHGDTIIVCQVPPQMRNLPQTDLVVGLLQQLAPQMSELQGPQVDYICDWLAQRMSELKQGFEWQEAQQLLIQLDKRLGQALPRYQAELMRPVDFATTIKSFDVE
ncbi:DNA mismatch repair endonuclease MutL [Motilimonas eburnea]|uniref:DNA mismatch repair endonuclease MutL n=1 Tax=Motilimonas eburnea TaxID=1737488 RepID=UPI001E6368B3|nr:DNA mismatch repair endonuclease MutL [Motilimonas eburnea]MCE2570580.1 DNA mismatch repair endonuclease MutL [Motilimonas eburnea]